LTIKQFCGSTIGFKKADFAKKTSLATFSTFYFEKNALHVLKKKEKKEHLEK
jgi:hypothetical protein